MNEQLIVHQRTADNIRRFIQHPSHALILSGPEGIGKLFIAQTIAQELYGLQDVRDVASQPYFKLIAPPADKPSISIEAVRELQQFAKLKLPANHSHRIIIIENAHSLTTEAQNALLKLLEEPPENTMLILTSSSSRGLLSTIRSRSQTITILQPAQADLTEYFTGRGHAAKDIQQAFMLSGGLPGLMHALLNDADHPLKAAVDTARTLLRANQFERLCLVDALSKKKPETLQVLFVLRHMASAAIAQAAATADGSADKRIRQWHKVMKAAYDAEASYAVSGSAKLTLTNLMLAM